MGLETGGETKPKTVKPELSGPLQVYFALHRYSARRANLLKHPNLELHLTVDLMFADSFLWSVARPGKYGTMPAIVAANQLKQDFNVRASDTAWVTDITYIRTHEGWLYLAAVIDLCSRKVVRWSMNSRMQTSLALNALLMAVWRSRPTDTVVVRSDQDSQLSGHEWRQFLADHNLKPRMNQRGNCYDSSVAESFFYLLKTERVRRKTYKTGNEARQDVFDYIEIFYNPKRRHANNWMPSPVDLEMTAK